MLSANYLSIPQLTAPEYPSCTTGRANALNRRCPPPPQNSGMTASNSGRWNTQDGVGSRLEGRALKEEGQGVCHGSGNGLGGHEHKKKEAWNLGEGREAGGGGIWQGGNPVPANWWAWVRVPGK